jgi:selenide,water dikinase
VSLAPSLDKTARDLVTDPQTSGGLLVSCAPEAVDQVLAVFREGGFHRAAVVGRVESGPAQLRVQA